MRKLVGSFLGTSILIRGAVDDLIPGFKKKTGYTVKPTYGIGLVTKKQVADLQLNGWRTMRTARGRSRNWRSC